ncbi:hypothetical protein BJV82DRAFT_718317 [Fennellomyces sp. T-0311]|nr:hypothetical protein BJV82DRAFT_718317 [Fennellomyces sp. T-0311]
MIILAPTYITSFVVLILLSLSPTLADVVAARFGQECVYLTPKIYCYGGRFERRESSGRLSLASDLFNSLDLSESKDLASLQGSWKSLPHETPGPNIAFTMVADPELKMIFMDGGLGPEDGQDLIRPRYNTTIFSVADQEWSTNTVSGHIEVVDHTAVLGLNNTVYVWGGYKVPLTSQWDNPVEHPLDMYAFNIRTSSWAIITGVASLAEYRIEHRGALGTDELSIYYIGGIYPSSPQFENRTRYNYRGAPMNEVTIFNTSTQEWRTQNTTGMTPSTRSGHTFTLKPDTGEFILFGGFDPMAWPISRPDYFYLLDVGSLSWSNRTISTGTAATQYTVSQVFDHSAVLVGNDLYIAFGNTANTSSNLVRVLDTESWSWRASIDGISHSDPANVPEDSSDSSDVSNSTSPGTIAGAVVGSIVGVGIAIAAVIFYLLRKRRLAQQNQYNKPNEFDAYPDFAPGPTPPDDLAPPTETAQPSTFANTAANQPQGVILSAQGPEQHDSTVNSNTGAQRLIMTPVKPDGINIDDSNKL